MSDSEYLMKAFMLAFMLSIGTVVGTLCALIEKVRVSVA